MTIKTGKEKADFTLEKVMKKAMRTPAVKVVRERFLRREFPKYYTEDIVSEAIRKNPAKAGVSRSCVDHISRRIINYETTLITGTSMAAGLPGPIVGTAIDVTAYFVAVLRAAQELAYLYGFEEFDLNEDSVNEETMDELLIFVGVMFNVRGAASALRKMADIAAENAEKDTKEKIPFKDAISPFIKNIAAKIGIQLTRRIFTNGLMTVIPLAGAVLSGGLTFAMFRPSCMRLRRCLRQYDLSDPHFFNEDYVDDTVFEESEGEAEDENVEEKSNNDENQ